MEKPLLNTGTIKIFSKEMQDCISLDVTDIICVVAVKEHMECILEIPPPPPLRILGTTCTHKSHPDAVRPPAVGPLSPW